MFLRVRHSDHHPRNSLRHRPLLALSALLLLAPTANHALAQQYPAPDAKPAPLSLDNLDKWNPKDDLLAQLPAPVTRNLDLNFWIWSSYLRTSQAKGDYTDTVFSVDVTKSFNQRIALSFEGNLINADGQWRGEVEQLYLSAMLSTKSQTLLTIGKFNANFGLEGRDFWNRTHGTTSLLFAAQPQDLVGIMITQPIGDTGIKLRPFIAMDFQGQFEFNQSPSVGLLAQYKPNRDLQLSLTNWIGPGMVLFGGRTNRTPYPQGGYDEGSATAIDNWQGPNLYAERGGTLYFMDANVSWRPTPGLTLGAEFLLATTGTSLGRWGWSGAMVTADYQVTDKLNLFARASYLDDSDWLVYGEFQKLCEGSAGAGYRLTEHVEFRAEYRHDFGTDTGSVDSLSLHISIGY